MKKRASAERETGMFSGMVPITGVSMNRLIIAGGFTVAVILGLFFGSSLLESNDVQSAATETQETKIVPQVVSEPVRKEPKVSDSETDEAVTETPDVASKGSTDVASFALPKPSKSTEKETDPDQAPEPQRKVSNSSTAQAANKPAAAKSAPKPALTPSTLVISPGNGKVKAKVEPGNGSAFTRPRVVANPKP